MRDKIDVKIPKKEIKEKRKWKNEEKEKEKKTSTAGYMYYIRCDYFIVTHCTTVYDIIW